MPDLGAFWRAGPARKALLLEALWELFRARIETMLPARYYAARLGRQGAAAAAALSTEQMRIAGRVGYAVARVAGAVPFRAVCLQQALAVRRMLRRRNVPATVYLGLSRDRQDGSALAAAAAAAAPGRQAHAWVTAGEHVVNGDTDLHRFAVVGTFS